ncbi:folate receptor alpha-like isoform X2 [Ischnura elegans]|nr:folate receptor alpha-like isoform X2 [Ischnura elegans]XP_046401663.1 folate receptor alpha-like isoform X2 [Ischnura elegans]
MSADCRRHFMQDLCFYECSPNIGPWIVKVDGMKIRKERYFEVPLCQKDCDAWFKDCYDDFTCTDNWSRNFKWSNGRNTCPEGSTCRTFAEVYGTATNFCSKVWDHSWKPVPDEEPCMRLWFNPAGGNPNVRVAEIYAARIAASRSDGCSISPLVPVILVFFSWLIYG